MDDFARAVMKLEVRNARKAGMLTGILLSVELHPVVRANIQKELDEDDKILPIGTRFPDRLVNRTS